MKNIFVLNINNYRPDLCVYTLPTIKDYAEKIDANLHIITERVFPDNFPVTIEKLQVHKLGEDAYWNILIDADFMLHPNLPDFTTILKPDFVGVHYGFPASKYFENDIYFERDGRNIGLAGGFIITSNLTHDLWSPPEIKMGELLSKTKRPFIIDEYCISRNLAKYGLKYTGLEFNREIAEMMIHIGNEEKSETERKEGVKLAKSLYEQWFSRSYDNNRQALSANC